MFRRELVKLQPLKADLSASPFSTSSKARDDVGIPTISYFPFPGFHFTIFSLETRNQVVYYSYAF
jgi:hypothetical protein